LLIDSSVEKTLIGKVHEIKLKYCNNGRTPIKYNLKDLKNEYTKEGSLAQYEKLLKN